MNTLFIKFGRLKKQLEEGDEIKRGGEKYAHRCHTGAAMKFGERSVK